MTPKQIIDRVNDIVSSALAGLAKKVREWVSVSEEATTEVDKEVLEIIGIIVITLLLGVMVL